MTTAIIVLAFIGGVLLGAGVVGGLVLWVLKDMPIGLRM